MNPPASIAYYDIASELKYCEERFLSRNPLRTSKPAAESLSSSAVDFALVGIRATRKEPSWM
jgi:hypothetical protein